MVDGHLVAPMGVVERDVGTVEEIVGEPLLDELLLIAGTDDKLGMAIVGILLHDMPQDGHTANLNHRLGPKDGLFGNAGSKTAC